MYKTIRGSWKEELKDEFNKEYFKNLMQFVTMEYATSQCYPSVNHIFFALEQTSFENVKVVIIGQDPYHGPGQANGLCFSVGDGIAIPPSLKNILMEISTDLKTPVSMNGNLERWTQQGILLLNATLTVRAGQAGSHQNKGWEIFTDVVISRLSDKREKLVFLLWGAYAKKKGAIIDRTKHLILTCGHPSPMSANRGLWFGNKHFSTVNEYLIENEKAPIHW